MSKIQSNNHNRIKNRFIAFALAMILAAVPVISHIGPKSGAKAADPIPVSISFAVGYEGGAYTPSTSESMTLAMPVDPHTLAIQPTVTVTGKIVDIDETTRMKVEVTDSKFSSVHADVDNPAFENSLTVWDPETDKGHNIYVYVKVKTTLLSGDTETPQEERWLRYGIEQIYKYLQNDYAYKTVNGADLPGSTNGGTIYTTAEEVKVVGTPYGTDSNGTAKFILGETKMGISTNGSLDVNTGSDPSNITWESMDSELPLTEGTSYRGYVGLFFNGDLVEINSVANQVVLDATNPGIDSVKILDSSDNEKNPPDYIEESETNNRRYMITSTDTSENLLWFMVFEKQDGSDYPSEAAVCRVDGAKESSGVDIYTADIDFSNAALLAKLKAGKDLVVIAEDVAGNRSAAVNLPKAVVVNKNLRFGTDIGLYVGDEKKNYTSTSETNYTKEQVVVKGTVSSGFPLDSIELLGKKNGASPASTIAQVDGVGAVTLSAETGLYTKTFEIALPEGKYEDLVVVARDTGHSPANSGGLGSFVYDAIAPAQIKDTDDNLLPYVKLMKEKAGTNVWEEVTADEIDNGVVVMDLTDRPYNYKYVYGASDYVAEDGTIPSYMKSVDLYSVAPDNEESLDYTLYCMDPTSAEDTSTTFLNGEWEVGNPYGDGRCKADANGVIHPIMVAEDYAGNQTVITDIPALKNADKDMIYNDTRRDVTVSLYRDAACTSVISLGTASEYYKTNKPVYAKLTASSGYPLVSVTFTGVNAADTTATPVSVSATVFDPATETPQNLKTKRYELSSTVGTDVVPYKVFTILPNPASNTQLQDIKVTVTDSKSTPQSVVVDLGNLWYDNTKPTVVSTVTGVNEKGWAKNPTLSVTIESGAAAPETDIVSGSYTITGSKGNVEGAALTASAGKIEKTWNTEIPESANPWGTNYVFEAVDGAGNKLSENTDATTAQNRSVNIKVDRTDPTISSVKIDQVPLAEISDPFSNETGVSIEVADNLSLANLDVQLTNAAHETWTVKHWDLNKLGAGTGESVGTLLTNKSGGKILPDGTYTITVATSDYSGRSAKKTGTFTIDSTKPEVTAKITGGSTAGKRPSTNFDGTARDYYYRGNVSMEFTYTEKDIRTVTVTDNGNPITFTKTWGKAGEKKWINTADFSSEGTHNVKISAVDKAGNAADEKSVTFVIDKGAPTITTTANGYLNFGDGTPAQEFTGDVRIFAGANDAIAVDNDDLNVKITTKRPDQSPTVSGYNKVSNNRTYSFSEEAEYSIEVFAVDMAGNRSGTRTMNFRLDRTAPKLTINGGAIGGVSASATTLTFSMEEAFWWDASGTVTIYRKAGDGAGESLYKTIDYRPTSRNTNMSELISQTGVYRIEFTARDKVGHTAQTSSSITIDRDAPKLTMRAIGNYMLTDKDVDFGAEITDDFYVSKRVEVNATRTKIDGTKETVPIGFVAQSANPTVISQLITEDGIYDITVTATDGAGNRTSDSVHFTIDKTNPEIIDLSEYDDKVVNKFFWDYDVEDLVNDLTVCETHIYLNGREYDGSSTIEDGSYTLLITAVDELGHKTERTIEFILDTKAPTFIVTGVEDGEIKNEVYNIGISLQLDEDTLTSVTLNGKAVDIKDDVVDLTVDQKGDYVLTMTARDEAGNESTQTIKFTFGEKRNYMPLIIGGIAALLALLGCSLFFVLSKRRKNL